MNNLQSLVKKAKKFIDEQRCFLLVYDVVDSRGYAEKHGYKNMYEWLQKFHHVINTTFKPQMVSREVGLGRNLAKMETIIGDSGGAYFSDLKVIKPIIDLANKTLPFKLRWAVAKDGWDKKNFEKKNMKIID